MLYKSYLSRFLTFPLARVHQHTIQQGYSPSHENILVRLGPPCDGGQGKPQPTTRQGISPGCSADKVGKFTHKVFGDLGWRRGTRSTHLAWNVDPELCARLLLEHAGVAALVSDDPADDRRGEVSHRTISVPLRGKKQKEGYFSSTYNSQLPHCC